MRAALLFLVLNTVLLSQDDQLPALESILSASEKQQFDRAPNFQEALKVLRRVLDRLAETTRRQLDSQGLDQVKESVQAIRTLAREGVQITARVTDRKALRSKSARRMEIRLRKMAEELDSLRKASPFELWGDFDAVLEDVKAFRSDLLEGFFAFTPPSSSSGFAPGILRVSRQVISGVPMSSPGAPAPGSACRQWKRSEPLAEARGKNPCTRNAILPHAFQAVAFLPTAAEPAQRRIRSSISGDQFTGVEYEQVQDAQELKPRVKVFLKIAEARLDEIERRMARIEREKEDPNPLEFYTYAQLARAYQRSLAGIMINIDEKARYKIASEKDIKKSLELLNSGIQTFLPRLEPVKKLAEEREDEDLYLEWREAWKASRKALQGSQFGLGAPGKQKDP